MCSKGVGGCSQGVCGKQQGARDVVGECRSTGGEGGASSWPSQLEQPDGGGVHAQASRLGPLAPAGNARRCEITKVEAVAPLPCVSQEISDLSKGSASQLCSRGCKLAITELSNWSATKESLLAWV